MKLTRDDLIQFFENTNVFELERKISRIMKDKKYDRGELFEKLISDRIRCISDIYAIITDRLTADEVKTVMNIIDLYGNSNRDIFFELGIIEAAERLNEQTEKDSPLV